jgi:hypothetical protein
MTSSAAKIGAPERTASASASLGRESISSSRPFTASVIEAKNVLSRSSVTATWVQRTSSSPSMSTSRSCVIGRGVVAPWSFIRIAAASGCPIQIGRNLLLSAVFNRTIGCLPTMSKLTP